MGADKVRLTIPRSRLWAALAGISIIIGAVYLTSSIISGRQPQNIRGWSKARWGMTENQVLNSFRGEVRVFPREETGSEGFYATIRIDDYALGGTKFEVSFLFDVRDHTLRGVNVYKGASEMDASFQGEDLFVTLERQLSEKYGQPSEQKKEKEEPKQTELDPRGIHKFFFETLWNLPFTSIRLTYNQLWWIGKSYPDPSTGRLYHMPDYYLEDLSVAFRDRKHVTDKL